MDTGAPQGSPTPDPRPDLTEGPAAQGAAPAASPAAGPSALDALPAPVRRRRIVSWALWDWGSAAFNAVITTFVFTVYLTGTSFVDPDVVSAADGAPDGSAAAQALDSAIAAHSSWLGWGLGIAGFTIALLAPVMGARADATGRRRFWLGVHTMIVVALSAAMYFVRPAPGSLDFYVLLGIGLLAAGNIFFELAAVNYNATLSQVSTPANVGKVSGFGWGAGYLGGIVLLLVLFFAFIDPEVGLFGVTSADGLNVRVSMLVAAAWFGLFAIPVLVAVPAAPATGGRGDGGLIASYRGLFRDVARLWREARHTVYFLVASAIYRDGLAGVFTFGAIIAAGTFGFSSSQVIMFGIAANVVAGLATIASGWFDDRFGPKAVVVTSLIGLIVAGMAVFFGHAGGPTVFWVFGLVLTIFVGPAQSASRTLLSRVIPPGRESEVFGLYATTGRAASFLAQVGFAAFILIGGAQYWGIIGIMLVLALGLALLLPVHPERATWTD
ncbi:MFS transporter [Actinotalea sp. M2MS4P-6]|uniref:MFS transporter n=1 Tax=Actinotalea sp. M2MS4P-6 TaxID=2983762 RepID=UPI0021E40EEF|nr:MFS transporter [Actinotalea sp. M2MS4P-6]MCV2396305.1 MFS transporter [Actinotalea sp. M2MS4P-6]